MIDIFNKCTRIQTNEFIMYNIDLNTVNINHYTGLLSTLKLNGANGYAFLGYCMPIGQN